MDIVATDVSRYGQTGTTISSFLASSATTPVQGSCRLGVPHLTRLFIGIAALCLAFLSANAAAPFSLQPGDLLLANYGGNNIIKINAATWEQQDLGTFEVPTDLVLAPGGLLYVTEFGGAIKRLNLTNGALSVIKPASTHSQFWGITLGPTGDLFVTCGSLPGVLRVNPVTGAETVLTSGPTLAGVIGIDLRDADHLVVGSILNNEILSIALADGTQASVVAGAQGIDQPWGIAAHAGTLFVTAYDRKVIQRITDTTVESFVNTPGFPYGIAIQSNGTLAVGSSGTIDAVVRFDSTGTSINSFTGGMIRQVTGIEIAEVSLSADTLTNTAPLLDPIADQSVTAGNELSFQVMATDTDWPPQTLTYTLDPGAPADATLSSTGLFSWTPATAPATIPITVRVTDNGDPALSATSTFTVNVTHNTAPVFTPIEGQTVYGGRTLSFVASATDADLPAQTLTFSLEPGGPAGASITPSGAFSWTPAAVVSPVTNSFTVRVTDSGSPPLSTLATFSAVVSPAVTVAPGDYLVATYSGNAVIRINPSTGDQARLAFFDNPTDVALGYGGGTIYVVEWSGRVKSFDLTNGVARTLRANTSVVEAWAIALGPHGELHVADTGGDGIVTLNPATGAERILSAGNLISGPYGVDLLDPTHLLIGSQYNNTLVSVALADGTQTAWAQENGLDQPWAVAVDGTNVWVGSAGLSEVQRVDGGAASSWYAPDGAPYGIAVETNGNLVIGVLGASAAIVRLDPSGNPLQTYSGGLLADPTGVEVYRVIPPPPPPPNTAPILATISDASVSAGTTVAFTASATDSDLPPQTLTFSLDPGYPTGATITSQGAFSWTPIQSQAPNSYGITVRVTDDGSPALSDTASFLITVQRTNTPPVPAAPTLTRTPTGTSKLSATAFLGTDPDGDPVSLVSAGPTSTAGGSVAIRAGWVTYTPPPGHLTGDTFNFTVSDGPGASTVGTATVVIASTTSPTANITTESIGPNTTRILGDGIPGRIYSIEYTEDLATPVWQALAIVEADPSGAFETVDQPPGGSPPRFYRAVSP